MFSTILQQNCTLIPHFLFSLFQQVRWRTAIPPSISECLQSIKPKPWYTWNECAKHLLYSAFLESKPLEKIQLKHLIIAFLILCVGCFVAFIVFIVELKGNKSMHKTAKGQQQRKWQYGKFYIRLNENIRNSATKLINATLSNEYGQWKCLIQRRER